MEKFKAKDIIHINDFSGTTIPEMYEQVYLSIGEYIINNAKRMASDTAVNNCKITLKIDIEACKLITIDKIVSEYLLHRKEEY